MSKKVKVKITSCSKPEYWYKDKVGEEFFVRIPKDYDYYFVNNVYLYGGQNYIGLIHKNDCKII